MKYRKDVHVHVKNRNNPLDNNYYGVWVYNYQKRIFSKYKYPEACIIDIKPQEVYTQNRFQLATIQIPRTNLLLICTGWDTDIFFHGSGEG